MWSSRSWMATLEYSNIGDGGRFLLDVGFGLRDKMISSGVMSKYCTTPIVNTPTANNDYILTTDIHRLTHQHQTLLLTGLPAQEPINPNLVDCILVPCRISTLHWGRPLTHLLEINSHQVIDLSYVTKIHVLSL